MNIEFGDVEFNDTNSLKLITKELRKEQYSVKNRLQSILYDYQFIKSLNLLHYPLVPNERCGLWYLPPDEYTHTAYFKSTDGHTNEWQFSYRRLNLHLVPVVEQHGGIVLIDSTRKGKLVPDALSKTIPIWCAVLNCLVFGLDEDKHHYLKVPSFVPETEKNQIVKRIPGFVKEAKRLNLVNISLSKPLAPTWIYPSHKKATLDPLHHHVICISASDNHLQNMSVRAGDDILSWKYIQGAGDDHELWAPDRLSPQMFWENLQFLTEFESGYITCNEQELNERLKTLHKTTKELEVWSVLNTGLYFGSITNTLDYGSGPHVENVVVLSKNTIKNVPKTIKVFHYELEPNKKGSKLLRGILPVLIPQLTTNTLVLCDNGKDLSIGVILAILCQKFDLKLQRLEKAGNGNKDLIKQFLGEINRIRPVSPSRNTLQSVNSYLM
ncbi:initiator tRNA phosphoribosyl transferase [Yamadazyma tenuis ATCC 10573]|uniref:Initiator tRNA phosphoribosyl transferase n=1 Tax=Candida tenuis (strain ATCC 10573 / BCRC 21748 / CBS 615 / JCM 9827 / NBRC 10315 / NRRL Y-1498 / VKM Y-70) TaxID=590646 RepID=G3AWZ7_CANTC|nr:initiator tRNA phosphoribosyl transferase [Yamadazyma tenuis ATCC 10573]EGV66650.1 initiator tRNA phosphoribosyl transferase [Yamadazyma tenuis ATCC 10573]